jgi:tellurite resistance protein TehA-like permease
MTTRPRAALPPLLAAIGSAAAAPVMGTGIVSVALELDGREAASDALLAVTLGLAVVLGAVLAVAVRHDPRAVARAASAPMSLTAVAGACVLGTRLTQAGVRAAGAALLGVAVVAWVPLLIVVLRRWRRPVGGAGFLPSVSAQAIAVLCGALGARGNGVLDAAALAFLAAGLLLYALAAASFDRRELRRGRGDQWVAGGALAIAALAATAIARAAAGALWALAMAWLPVLLAGELMRPRRGFDARRWSTVFPVGMYAAMSRAVGELQHAPAIVAFARGWTWVAVAVWALVATASLRCLVRVPDRARTRGWRRPGAPDRIAP